MFIKTVLEAAFSFPNILQITKAALNHVDNIQHVEKIARNVRLDFVGFTRRVRSKYNCHGGGQYRAMWCSSCCCTEKNRESNPGIANIISLWQLSSNKNISLKLLELIKTFFYRSHLRPNLCYPHHEQLYF